MALVLEPSQKRLLKGSSWTLSGTILSKVLVFCATILVARILTKEMYGELGIIRSTIQMFVAVSSFGIGSTATKYIAEHRNKNPELAGRIYWIGNVFIFAMGFLALILLMFGSEYIAAKMLNAPELSADLKIGGIILFFSILNGAQLGALAGFEDFRFIAISNLINGFSEIILLPIGAYLWGLSGAVLGFGLSFLIVFIFNSFRVSCHFIQIGWKTFDIIRQIKLKDFRVICDFSFPIALSSWINMLTYWFSKTLLIKDAGFGQMANYDVATQIQAQLLFIPGILSQVLLPILVNNMSTGKSGSARSAFKMNLCLNVLVTFSAFLLILLFGRYILMIYGKTYTSVFPLYVLCFCTILDSIANSCVPIVISANKIWSVLWINIAWSAVLLVSYIMCSRYVVPENALTIAYLCAAMANCLLVSSFIRLKSLI